MQLMCSVICAQFPIVWSNVWLLTKAKRSTNKDMLDEERLVMKYQKKINHFSKLVKFIVGKAEVFSVSL